MKKKYPVDRTGMIAVDLQPDFTAHHQGALPAEGSDQAYIDSVTQATQMFYREGYPLFATQDYHPENHISFYTSHAGKKPFDLLPLGDREQVLWPPHCVQGSEKAALLLEPSLFSGIARKGMDERYDSYSGFFDDGGARTDLDAMLRSGGIQNLLVYGLALDYCVKATALDAVSLGYQVCVLTDLCRSVAAETGREAVLEMKAAGVDINSLGEISH